MSLLQTLRVYLFPPVTRNAALEIASRALATTASKPLIRHAKKPDRFCIYVSPPEPCWYVEVPWDDGKDGVMLRSSRVIVIGRRTGVIHYDGSAGDEG